MNSATKLAVVTFAILLSACAGLPHEKGYRDTAELVRARVDLPAPEQRPESMPRPAIPDAPITRLQAQQLAFTHNPRVLEAYARLGIGRAELEDARRLANPSVGYSRLAARDGGGHQLTSNLSFGLDQLLLLPARKRFASSELQRVQQAVADDLLALASEVEVAWFEAVSAQQVAAMRAAVAAASERSAALAERFFDAGNIHRLQLEQEYAAATEARIDALRADAEARRARAKLAGLMGLPFDAAWTTSDQLPAPAPAPLQSDVDALVALAMEQRLDLAAAHRAVANREDALGVSRRWRWLGAVEAGYERERDGDGSVMRGPSLALGLPIFNQGQGAVTRAQAELLDARAQLDGLLLAVHSEVRVGSEALSLARDIVERYRTALLPRREAVVARTQERVNFMLVGVFELIQAKREEYDAYQEYLEAMRDYWTAHAELRRIVGGRLPDDGDDVEATIGVDAILPAAKATSIDHSMHHAPAQPASEPHTEPAPEHTEHEHAEHGDLP